jgi:polar amino acid transport system substrate-binding protein
MSRIVLMLALTLAVGVGAEVIGVQILYAQQTPDPRVADLVRAGRVRVGFGLGPVLSAIKDPATGEVWGPSLDLARALAARIGIELQTVEYPRPGAVLEGVRTNAWDVAFLVIDPDRAAEADFSPPFMQSDFTYLVRAGSSIRNVADADQPGVRIAVPRGDASELYLSRTLKRAELVRTESHAAAENLLRTGDADAYAGPRPVALTIGARLPGSRVLEDHFLVIYRAALVPKGHAGRLAYVSEFIEEAKASGLVKQIIERHGLQGVQVAPAGNPSSR